MYYTEQFDESSAGQKTKLWEVDQGIGDTCEICPYWKGTDVTCFVFRNINLQRLRLCGVYFVVVTHAADSDPICQAIFLVHMHQLCNIWPSVRHVFWDFMWTVSATLPRSRSDHQIMLTFGRETRSLDGHGRYDVSRPQTMSA